MRLDKCVLALLASLYIATTVPASAEEKPSTQSKKDNEAKSPTLEEMQSKAIQTLESLKASATHWQVRTTAINGAPRIYDVIRNNDDFKLTMVQINNGNTVEMFTVLQKDGTWHVKELGMYQGQYLPFTYASYMIMYAFLGKEEIRIPSQWGKVTKSTKTELTLQIPMNPATSQQLQVIYKNLKNYTNQLPADHPSRHVLEKRIAMAEDMIENGTKVIIAPRTGLVKKYVTPQETYELIKFEAIKDFDPAIFSPAKLQEGDITSTAGDHTQDLAKTDPANRILFLHAPFWEKGQKDRNGEYVIIDRETGNRMRPPVASGIISSAGFSRDRKSVYCVTAGPTTATTNLFNVDLTTGENILVTESLPKSAMLVMPTESPDKKYVALAGMISEEMTGAVNTPTKGMPIHLYLIETETGAVHEPIPASDTTHRGWFPDSKALLIEKKHFVAMDKPSSRTFGKLSLDGTYKEIGSGEFATLLNDRILFRDAADDLWYTCAYDGSDKKIFRKGMPHCMFPTVSPDGTEVLFMLMKKAGPLPVIISATDPDKKAERIPYTSRGLWSMPRW